MDSLEITVREPYLIEALLLASNEQATLKLTFNSEGGDTVEQDVMLVEATMFDDGAPALRVVAVPIKS